VSRLTIASPIDPTTHGYAMTRRGDGGRLFRKAMRHSRRVRALPRLFISHSSKNDDWSIALKDWLVREGWR